MCFSYRGVQFSFLLLECELQKGGDFCVVFLFTFAPIFATPGYYLAHGRGLRQTSKMNEWNISLHRLRSDVWSCSNYPVSSFSTSRMRVLELLWGFGVQISFGITSYHKSQQKKKRYLLWPNMAKTIGLIDCLLMMHNIFSGQLGGSPSTITSSFPQLICTRDRQIQGLWYMHVSMLPLILFKVMPKVTSEFIVLDPELEKYRKSKKVKGRQYQDSFYL